MAKTTNTQMLGLESSTRDQTLRFAINWARNQYGNATARAVAGLAIAGRQVAVGQFGNGFIVDGLHMDAACLRLEAGEKRRDGAIGGE